MNENCENCFYSDKVSKDYVFCFSLGETSREIEDCHFHKPLEQKKVDNNEAREKRVLCKTK